MASQVNADLQTLFNWVNTSAIWADGSTAFTNVPTGPATDPTSANQLARKSYVDARYIPFSPASWTGLSGSLGTHTILLQAGTFVGTTNGSGEFIMNYPSIFPNGLFGVMASIGDSSADVNITVGTRAANTAGTFVTCWHANTGAVVNTASVRINWLAIGF